MWARAEEAAIFSGFRDVTPQKSETQILPVKSPKSGSSYVVPGHDATASVALPSRSPTSKCQGTSGPSKTPPENMVPWFHPRCINLHLGVWWSWHVWNRRAYPVVELPRQHSICMLFACDILKATLIRNSSCLYFIEYPCGMYIHASAALSMCIYIYTHQDLCIYVHVCT